MTTIEGRRPASERALRVAVPALGVVVAVVLLATSTHLTGPSGWYARVMVILLGVVSLVGTIAEVRRVVRERGDAVPATEDAGSTASAEPADPDEPVVASRGALARVLIVVASIVAMVLLANVLGLWLAMLIPVVATLLVLGVRTWWKVALAAGLTVAGGYVVFTLLLQVRVPEGVLGLL